MQALTLPARRGWRWLAEGFLLFRQKQLMLTLLVLGYWMMMAVINSMPLLGQIAATLLIPVFSVSLMNTCRAIEQGRLLAPQLLFSGFNSNLRPLLLLGAIYLGASSLIFSATVLVDDGLLFKLVIFGQRPDEELVATSNIVAAGQLALLMFLPLMMAYWFAPVLVAWHGLSASKALFFSFIACLRNWRAFLVYAISVVLIGALLPGFLVGTATSLFAGAGGFFSVIFTVLIVLVLLPTLYASFYISYRDVFVTSAPLRENA